MELLYVDNSGVANINNDLSSITRANGSLNVSPQHYDGISHSYPPIFILNLDRSKNRWENVLQEVQREGLIVERMPAVDGRSLSLKELQQVSTQFARFFQPRGVLGCYLSHRKFWQTVIDRNLTSAIILEDDVRLVEKFQEKLESQLELLNIGVNRSYDVIFLGAIGRVDPKGNDGLPQRIFSAYIGGSRPFKRLSDNYYQPSRPAGTHAYMVTNQGARKLLSLCPNAVFHVDLDAWRHKSLKMVLMDPMLVFQTFESTQLTDFSSDSTMKLGSRIPLLAKVTQRLNKMKNFTVDYQTNQSLSHILDEPLIQLGPRGPIITVERHTAVVLSGCLLASLLQAAGLKFYSRSVMAAVGAFIMSVRSIIWLLMNWR